MTTERDIRNQIAYAEEKGMEKGMEKGREEAKAANRKIFDELRSKGVDETLLNEVFRKYIP